MGHTISETSCCQLLLSHQAHVRVWCVHAGLQERGPKNLRIQASILHDTSVPYTLESTVMLRSCTMCSMSSMDPLFRAPNFGSALGLLQVLGLVGQLGPGIKKGRNFIGSLFYHGPKYVNQEF